MKISLNSSVYNTKRVSFGDFDWDNHGYMIFGGDPDASLYAPGGSSGSDYRMPKWNRGLLNIHHRSESDMRDFAEYFNDSSDDDIRRICSEAYYTYWGAHENAAKLMEAVHKVQAHKQKILDEIAILTQKAAMGESNIVNQKMHVKNVFINFLKKPDSELDYGNDYPIANGILIYGKSSQKENFVNWISTCANEKSSVVVAKEFDFDETNPLKSLKELISRTKEYNDAYYNTAEKHILLKVNNLDSILKPAKTEEQKVAQAAFKNFMENCAKKYHTTIIAATPQYTLDKFENSAIGSQRFTMKIYLKDGILPVEADHLKELKAEIERLDKKANQKVRFMK